MKKELPMGAIVAILVLVVLIIGFLAYRTFIGTDPTVTPNDPIEQKRMADSQMKRKNSLRDAYGRSIPGTEGTGKQRSHGE